MAIGRRARDRLPPRAVPRWPTAGILALIGAKSADAATTAVALTFLPITELNPVVRALIAHFGVVPGVLVGSGAVVGLIMLVTESGVFVCRRLAPDRRGVAHIRYVGYGLPAAVFVAAAVYNLSVMLAVA